MSVFTALFYVIFLGAIFLKVVLQEIPIKNRFLFYCAMAFPTGAGCCSLILFFSYLLAPSQARFLSPLLGVIFITLSLGYLCLKPSLGPSKNLAETIHDFLTSRQLTLRDKSEFWAILLSCASFILFVFSLFAVTQFFFLAVSTNILGGWDSRFFWFLKAKFFFRSPAEWQNMFSAKIFWSHPDYPLLFPGILAWGWNWVGQELILWSPIVSFCFYVSCVFLLVWYVQTTVSSFAGWLAGTFLMTLQPYLFWALHQYADVPVCFFMTASGLSLAVALRSGHNRLFFLPGLMAGFAAWTKNEGLSFLAEISFLLGIYTLLRRYPIRDSAKSLVWFLSGILIPFIAVVVLKTSLGTTVDYWDPQRSILDYKQLFFGENSRTAFILQSFFVYMTSLETWRGTWILFLTGAFVLAATSSLGQCKSRWVVFSAVLLINAGYFTILHLSTYEIAFQIQTALDRLILHSGILAVAFCFESLNAPFLLLHKKQATP